MATLRLKNIRSEYMYEYAWSSDVDTWFAVPPTADGRYVELPENGSPRILIRVTADKAEFQSTAYDIQRGYYYSAINNTLYTDYKTIQLNVPDGTGTTRTDSYAFNFSDPAHALIESGSLIDLQAFNQQVDLERQIGVVFDYNGTKLRGTTTSRTDSKALEAGGYVEGFEAIITSSRKQWINSSVSPILGASIALAGVKYRIATITINGGHFDLALSKYRGN
jgi:hypothetical protein